jgi:hypothetical protein
MNLDRRTNDLVRDVIGFSRRLGGHQFARN